MADHLGTFNASSTVTLYFTTHEATGAPVAPSSAFEAADLLIYKNGSATQRSSANGITMTSPFDSVTGLHCVAIDLSDNTDSGFYAAGSEYVVILNADETVDSVAVTKVLAYFSIERVPKVNVTQISGDAQSATDLKDFADAGYDPSTNKVQGVVLVDTCTTNTDMRGTDSAYTGTPPAASAIADAVWDEATSGHTTSGTFGEQCKTDIDAILADTAEIGAAGAGLTALPWNAAWDAEVQSECTDALNAYDPPTNTEMVAAFTEIKGATWNSSTDTLEAIRDRGDAAWITATGFSTLDAAGIRTAVGLASANLDTQLSTIDTEIGVIDGIVDDILVDTAAIPTTAEIKAGLDIGASGGVAGHTTLSGVSTNVSAILADTGTDGVILSAATCNKIADHARRRTQANVEASSDGDTLGISSEYGFIQQAQESNTTDNAGKLTVYRTDGTTELAQKTLTTDETAEPITGIE